MLCSQPLFYHLPDNLQKHILQFIYQHCDDINLTVFKQFLQSLFESCCKNADWIELYLNLLQSRLTSRQKENSTEPAAKIQRTEKNCDRFRTSLTTEFQFSEMNKVQLLSLCDRLRVVSNCGSSWNVGGLFSRSSEIGEEEVRKTSTSVSGTSYEANDLLGAGVIQECAKQDTTEISLEKPISVNDSTQIGILSISQ